MILTISRNNKRLKSDQQIEGRKKPQQDLIWQAITQWKVVTCSGDKIEVTDVSLGSKSTHSFTWTCYRNRIGGHNDLEEERTQRVAEGIWACVHYIPLVASS